MRNLLKILVALILLVLFAGCKQDKEYQVFALKFVDAEKAPARDFVIGASQSDTLDITDMFWLIKDPEGKNILVDAGFIDSTNASEYYIRPDSVLLSLNISPGDISDIIITHPHFDHVGGITLFPNALIWMNQDDYDYFTVEAWEEGGVSTGFNKTDVNNLISMRSQGRVKLVNGDNIEIMPGIKVFTGSKHTYENIYLLVNSGSVRNKILLASDASWFYLNLEKELPVSLCIDSSLYIQAIKRMKTMVTDPDLIIPGHDNEVFLKFPGVNDRVVRIEKKL